MRETVGNSQRGQGLCGGDNVDMGVGVHVWYPFFRFLLLQDGEQGEG